MIHFLTGENTFATDRNLQRLLADWQGDVERLDGSELTVEQLPDVLQGATLFSSERMIVIKNVSDNRTVWSVLADWLEKGVDNNVVFVEKNPDKRTKTFKWLEKNAEQTKANELSVGEAVRWLLDEAKTRNMTLDNQTAQYMVDYVGTDQWRLSSEFEKLRLSGKELNKELVRALVEPTPQATSFELLDAAFAGRKDEVGWLLHTVARTEDPYMFFGLLASQVYALLAVKSGADKRPEEIAKDVGIHPFVLRKVSTLARQLSTVNARLLVTRLAELDANMKSRAVDPWTQIEVFLLAFTTNK